ncbi:MAG TPA: hypothetical protein VNS63_06580 [Blastocatellia bacterium]|nr:hypothetical protein [Blastocatellia bacterium]
MTLREASARFLEHLQKKKSRGEDPAPAHARTLQLLTSYLPEAAFTELTPARLRDFIARWYVEHTNHQPVPQEFLYSLEAFLSWVDVNEPSKPDQSCHSVIAEVQESLPRALEIGRVLSSHLQARGAFGFPEFLTSFEEGGRSQYDLDVGGSVGALEGFFRVSRIEATAVEAEELISGERVWPVLFPRDVAALLETGYIINLELVRAGDAWQIAACGFAYPPGTEF